MRDRRRPGGPAYPADVTVARPPTRLEDALVRIDAIADRWFEDRHIPGLVYGVVFEGRLVHTRSKGTLRVGEDAPPGPSSVFRIASMTKSFTAATVLHLRDEGRLRLDDDAAMYLPDLAGLHGPTADSPAITIRHLLTMTAGFPTDDPWGDRQQSLDLDRFAELLRAGLSFAWAPGTRFEYSNTGYGILGRVITKVAGIEYRDAVRERILGPLRMDSSGFLAEEVEPDRLALGYVWRDGAFVEEPMDPYGALAAMGGMFTSVDDLATWVTGFVDAFPPRDDVDDWHPLGRASRREMQQPMVPADFKLLQATPDAVPELESMHYGFGLFQTDDARFGRVVAHSGGYPGYGTHMRWHPGSGLGIVALANARYAPTGLLARDQLADLLRADVAPTRRIRPSSTMLRAKDAVDSLLAGWDDAVADEWLAMNIDLDEPIELRKQAFARIRERHGALAADTTTPPESMTPFHVLYWLRGDRGGRVRVELLLSPELDPRIQTLNVTSIPEPPALIRRAADRLVEQVNAAGLGRPVDWPSDIAVAEDIDLGGLRRTITATGARFAPVSLSSAMDGDGERKATYRLHSDRGHLDLALEIDPEAACVADVSLAPVKQGPPDVE